MYMYLLFLRHIGMVCLPFKCNSNFMTTLKSQSNRDAITNGRVYYTCIFSDKHSPVKLNNHPSTPEFINLQVCR